MDPVEVCGAVCPELLETQGCALDSLCEPAADCEGPVGEALCCMLEERPVECAALMATLGAGLPHEQHVCMEQLKAKGCAARRGELATAAPEVEETTTVEPPTVAAAVQEQHGGSASTTAFPTNWFVSSHSGTTAFPTNWFVSSSSETSSTAAPAATGGLDDIPRVHVMPFDDCFNGICDNTKENVTHLQSVNASSNAQCRGICLNATNCDFSSFCPLGNTDCLFEGMEGNCVLYSGCRKNSTTAWLANDAGWSTCPRLHHTR